MRKKKKDNKKVFIARVWIEKYFYSVQDRYE